MKKILITGAGGYIGSISTYLFLEQGYHVVALDNFETGYKQPLDLLQKKYGSDKLKIYEADLTKDLSFVFQEEKDIEAVIHYAASCKVDESMKKPDKYFINNVFGSQKLLQAMNEAGVKKIIFSSTCAVYGDAQYVPIDERHPTNPANPYGESKRMTEKIIEWCGKIYGFQYVILRYFNVCGASDDGLIGDSKKPSVLLVQNVVRGALGLEPFYLTYPEFDTPDRSPIRDYINVVDLNEAHLKALEYLVNGGQSQIINLGTGAGNSVLEVVEKVEQETGKTIERKKAADLRQGEYPTMIASIEKAKSVLGWTPKRGLKESVDSLIKWYSEHPQGWDKD